MKLTCREAQRKKEKKSPKIIPFKHNGKKFAMRLLIYLFIYLKITQCNITLCHNSFNNMI